MATNIKALTVSKPMNPKTLIGSSVTILNERLVDEYTAHFFYKNAANWCKGVNYMKAAAYFEKEAESELEHANKLQKYLVDWNSTPTLPAVKPNIVFSGLIDIINKAYLLEYGLFEKYNADSAKVFSNDLKNLEIYKQSR